MCHRVIVSQRSSAFIDYISSARTIHVRNIRLSRRTRERVITELFMMKMILGMKQACVCQGVPIKRKDDGLEVKSGNLFLIQSHQGKCVRIPVHVRVYQNCFEHYAIVNRDGKFANKGIFVNLKNSTVLRSDTCESEFLMVPDNVEGTSYTFQAPTPTEAADWADVLRPSVSQGSPTHGHPSPTVSPVIPRMPLMPTLAEEEES